jgi:hypothetical protein
MEEHLIDICDVDGQYFVDVRVWLDRAADRFYFPRASAERLGELAADGNFYFLRGEVEAVPEEVNVGGLQLPAWGVSVGRLRIRPSSTRTATSPSE